MNSYFCQNSYTWSARKKRCLSSPEKHIFEGTSVCWVAHGRVAKYITECTSIHDRGLKQKNILWIKHQMRTILIPSMVLFIYDFYVVLTYTAIPATFYYRLPKYYRNFFNISPLVHRKCGLRLFWFKRMNKYKTLIAGSLTSKQTNYNLRSYNRKELNFCSNYLVDRSQPMFSIFSDKSQATIRFFWNWSQFSIIYSSMKIN